MSKKPATEELAELILCMFGVLGFLGMCLTVVAVAFWVWSISQ